jgi:hypothetical protein
MLNIMPHTADYIGPAVTGLDHSRRIEDFVV